MSRNPLKIRASLGLGKHCGVGTSEVSQSLKDQGKSRTRTRSHIREKLGVAIP